MEEQTPARSQPERGLDKQDRATAVKLVLGLLVTVLFIVFVIQNSRPVAVDFVFATTRIRLIWVFIGCALIGALIAWLMGRSRRRAQRRLIQELERYKRDHD